ncbi:MAG: hypothetical protein A3F16_04000 [Deltaproteobacteria bacterium RIFCSPHIGHO2_12_FULL_43_9]|nr:MAG: hypothetical protein A3F16_04000 [Deltaproteobacteria bacterium RIFCSPHIGHO2_12_FULL_43_9]
MIGLFEEMLQSGCANITRQLSSLFNSPVTVEVKKDSKISYKGSTHVIFSLISWEGESEGIVSLVLDFDSAIKISNLLTKSPKKEKDFLNEEQFSMFRELTSIISHGLVDDLANRVNNKFSLGTPSIFIGPVGSLEKLLSSRVLSCEQDQSAIIQVRCKDLFEVQVFFAPTMRFIEWAEAA